jgi:hypothetical protein
MKEFRPSEKLITGKKAKVEQRQGELALWKRALFCQSWVVC